LRSRERRGGHAAAFSLGALTGLLPCGVSWLAVLQAAALGGPARGAVFLASFGAGTAPALLAVGLLGGAALARVGGGGARRARLAGGGMLVAAGLLALLRVGWALGSGDAGPCPACPP
jgi:sulfite exporter TauE/SafE